MKLESIRDTTSINSSLGLLRLEIIVCICCILECMHTIIDSQAALSVSIRVAHLLFFRTFRFISGEHEHSFWCLLIIVIFSKLKTVIFISRITQNGISWSFLLSLFRTLLCQDLSDQKEVLYRLLLEKLLYFPSLFRGKNHNFPQAY